MSRDDVRNRNGLAAGWVVVIAVLAAVIGAGIMYILMDGGYDRGDQKETAQNQSAEEQTTEEQQKESAIPDMELYQAAVDGEMSIRCEYPEDGHLNVAYLRANGDIRINDVTDKGTDHLVNLLDTKDKVYYWQKGGSQGYEYNAETYAQHFEDDEYDVFEQKTFKRKVDASAIECEDVGTVDRQLFTKPKNIPFAMPTNQL